MLAQRMIHVYIADSEAVSRKYKLELFSRKLPESERERAHRYKNAQDAYNFILGRLLLKDALVRMNMAVSIEQINYLESGKPFLKNVSFNISHSVDRVVCAIAAQGTIGVDIEKERSLVLENFKPWFTGSEWQHICSADKTGDLFYWYWTRKESIIKALGINLSDLHKIELDPAQGFFNHGGQHYYLNDLDIGNHYYGAVCSQVENAHVEFVYPEF